MKHETAQKDYLGTILVVRDRKRKTKLDSLILSDFNIAYFSNSEYKTLLSWIQQNQPSLIIFELDYPQKTYSDLIATLKLDWLTRNISIVMIGNRFALQSVANLDYDVYLDSAYTIADLEKVVCSLVHTPACQVYAG